MTTTAFGPGVETIPNDGTTPTPMPTVAPLVEVPEGTSVVDLVNGLRVEMNAAVADIERRLAQAREIEYANATGLPRQTVHTEDLNIGKHLIDGYTVTANSPGAGSIAWANLHVVLLGVDYTIDDGNTANKYVWFIKPGSGTTATLQSGNTLPVLSPSDALIFVNSAGVPISALETSISYAVGPGVIGNAQLATDVSTVLSTLQANDVAQQAQLDGAITTYYQDNAPWPEGAPSPDGGNANMGDIWYDANDGGAFRWTGATPGGGVTANHWQRIADTDTSALAGKIDTKTTTYLKASTNPPVAPAGGFSVGDLWMVLDMNNLLRRWDGAWVDLQLGDAAISSIGGAKVGSGINATNITTGTMPGTLVGTGVSPAVLTGTGTAPMAAIPTLTPAKLNTAFHMLY